MPTTTVTANYPFDNIMIAKGEKEFEGRLWKEAVRYFLLAMLCEDPAVMANPEIIFGDLALVFEPTTKRYWAYGSGSEEEVPNHYFEQEVIRVDPTQETFERGLLRFISDNRKKMITVRFDDGGVM